MEQILTPLSAKYVWMIDFLYELSEMINEEGESIFKGCLYKGCNPERWDHSRRTDKEFSSLLLSDGTDQTS